ncbi:MAG TPA: M23 family metallopeptidase [Solirubrobacteraceae bacterium]|nr:M23 family metallopeptidase [Solirubrobacteraceae bacterium]
MLSPRWSYLRRLWALPLAVLLLAALAPVGGGDTSARAASSAALQQQISAGQSAISSLSGAVGSASARVDALTGSVAAIERRIAGIQARLDSDRQALLRLRAAEAAARVRLARLEAAQAQAESTLSQQLIAGYEGDQPDMVTVVLEARGFKDLLERLSFMSRVRRQTAGIVSSVRVARRAVAAQAVRLGVLEVRQQKLASQVLAQRNSLDGERAALVGRQLAAIRIRSARAGALAGQRARVASLQHQLASLQAAEAQAAQAAAAQAASATASASSGTPSAGPGSGGASAGGSSPAGSSGGFSFPLPKSAASPPGTWSLDQGVDISAPGDSPEFAVCSGTIVLHGIGGFGPWAPVLHCDSPVGGYDYVYYGHAGPANQLPVGSHVGAGQVMSSVGPGIVGMSTGPHIEIGFADGSGTPVGGGSASAMMSLLQGSY